MPGASHRAVTVALAACGLSHGARRPGCRGGGQVVPVTQSPMPGQAAGPPGRWPGARPADAGPGYHSSHRVTVAAGVTCRGRRTVYNGILLL